MQIILTRQRVKWNQIGKKTLALWKEEKELQIVSGINLLVQDYILDYVNVFVFFFIFKFYFF